MANTENLIAKISPHYTSREMDMQLHNHCVIMNGTQCPDGKAKSSPHYTSRKMDMQLHSHCVIMNDTHCRDGKWRSLWHESIVDAEWLGSYSRQLLTRKVQELGYEISETQAS